jgi:hypothetical protein
MKVSASVRIRQRRIGARALEVLSICASNAKRSDHQEEVDKRNVDVLDELAWAVSLNTGLTTRFSELVCTIRMGAIDGTSDKTKH